MLATSNIKASDGKTESLQWTIGDKKEATYGTTKMRGLDATINTNPTWNTHADVKKALTAAKGHYDLLPDADKTALKDVSLAEYKRMVTDKLFAAQKFASKDTAKELPA
jgi:hypothetical protein